MANHKQHLTFSTVSGVVFSGLAWYPCGFSATTCLLAGGLCSVGGLVPDMDSDSSRSFQDCMSITSCVASMLVVTRLSSMGTNQELVAIIGAAVFFGIKFGMGRLIKRMTVHRGLIHSIPFAILCGEIVFLLVTGGIASRTIKAVALTVGMLSHLLLDEIYSFQVTKGKVRIKKSFGTALKFLQFNQMPLYAVLYGLIAVSTYLSFNQPALINEMLDKNLDKFAHWSVQGMQNLNDVSQKTQQQLYASTNISQRFGVDFQKYSAADDQANSNVDLLARNEASSNINAETKENVAREKATQQKSRRRNIISSFFEDTTAKSGPLEALTQETGAQATEEQAAATYANGMQSQNVQSAWQQNMQAANQAATNQTRTDQTTAIAMSPQLVPLTASGQPLAQRNGSTTLLSTTQASPPGSFAPINTNEIPLLTPIVPTSPTSPTGPTGGAHSFPSLNLPNITFP